MGGAQAYGATVIVILVALALTAAANPGSEQLFGYPAFGVCVAFAFLVQWLVFVPSYLLRTEKLFDLTGSLTYITVALLAAAAGEGFDWRSAIIVGLVVVWAGRLGSFLAIRVHKAGFDRRFDDIKQSFPVFLMTWTLQGLWVSLTFSAGIAAITSSASAPLGVFAAIGIALWVIGFVIEVVADRQKTAFRADPQNAEKFITSGLWARSRHPNYFGEIMLWTGIAVIAFPVLEGWQLVTLISPVFVWVLLTKISGVRMLEARGRKRWGDDEAYREYAENTPTLIPRLF